MLRILGLVLLLLTSAVFAVEELDFDSAIEEAKRLLDSGEIDKLIQEVEQKMNRAHSQNTTTFKNITTIGPINVEEIPFDSIESKAEEIKNQVFDKRINLLVFVSSSMPEQTIKKIMLDTEKIGGTLILQGFVGGDFNQTREWLQHIIGDASDTSMNPNIAIDPTGFERFKITAVPAYMAIEGSLPVCNDVQCPLPEHVFLSGNVEVPWALRKLGDGKPEWQRQLYSLAAATESL